MATLALLTLLSVLSVAFSDPLNFVSVLPVNRDSELGYRLPNNTFPIHYDIVLRTNIHLGETVTPEERFHFEGQVSIQLEAAFTTSTITLHARQLHILDAKLFADPSEDPIQSWPNGEDIEFDEKFEFLEFNLDEPLEEQTVYLLVISYEGELRGDQGGFYHSSYLDEEGSRQWLATTQFEQTDARHAFPCYDEPGIRATYGLSIIHGTSYSALANTQVLSKELDVTPGYTKTTFEVTPIMQTYLLCFVISDFTYVEIHSRIPQRVFAPKHLIEVGRADFAVRSGVSLLRAIDSYFGMDYAENAKKMDQVAIPEMFFGAMENWGLVTYDQNFLLHDPKRNTWAEKHMTANIIAHEYTHQYFGNLVSPKWWSYVWLNEGFANMYGYLIVKNVYPEFHDEEFFQFSQVQGVMDFESFGATRPMTKYVEDPESVRDLFDNIAYPKSGSVLRMWMNAISEATWKKGLNMYLKRMALKAATSKDLSAALQEAVDQDGVDLGGLSMDDIVENWSRTEGVPIVTVSLTDDNKLVLNQSAFLYSSKHARSERLWFIPVTVASASKFDFERTNAHFWMKTTSHTQAPSWPRGLEWKPDDWIVVNLKQTGYYRVNYEPKLWDRIVSKLNSETFEDIHHMSRAQLVEDVMKIARADEIDYRTVFRVLEYLKQEKHFSPWVSASSGMNLLWRLLRGTDVGDLLSEFLQLISSHLYDHYGLQDFGNSETWGEKLAREKGIAWACATGYSNCRQQTLHLLREVLEGRQEVIPDYQQTVYCAAIHTSGSHEFVGLWIKLQNETDPAVRSRIIAALGCTPDSLLQITYLDTTIESRVRPWYSRNEGFSVIQAVYAGSNEGLMTSLSFLETSAKAVQEQYGGVEQHATNLALFVMVDEALEKYRALLTKLKAEAIISEDTEKSLLDIAQVNIDWGKREVGEIKTHLEQVLRRTNSAHRLSALSGFLVAFALALTHVLK